jgi:2-methylcitrate dehydratase PrpD
VEDEVSHMTRKTFLGMSSRSVAATMIAAAIGKRVGAAPAPVAGKPAKLEGAAIKGATEAVTTFVVGTKLSAMPPEVIAQGKRCLVDGVGVVLAGSTLRGSAIIRDYVRGLGGKQEATAVGADGFMASAAHAALINAGSGHAMDYDDTQLSTTPDRTFWLLTHPTTPALAAALAIGERQGASGAAFLEAFLVGFEVECKIVEAIDPQHYEQGFHSTGTIGTFGAAAAAAKLMTLRAENVGPMLAIASSMSSGIRVNFGSMTKPLHAARAAENGIVAAELASRGFTGGENGLDGQWGFFQVLGGGADLDRLVPVLGKPYTIVKPGVSVKPYPCGSLSHPTLDAMLKVVTDHDLKPEQIKAVRVRAGNNILEPLRYKTAKNELEAKFCLPFLMTSIILRRRAGVREFTDEFVASAPVQQMMSRVTGVFDQKIDAMGYDKIRSVVEIDLTDGRSLVQASDDRYRGGPERPFTREELHAKFTDCAQLTLPNDRIQQALTQIETVDALKNIRELVKTLA